ncbi:kinase-like domain-containing protein [Gigaspora rosea]|uniref:Kinase-like domain-containing protein n=1 Tax=Gigaspora rosea TaxID=44941 RepID=A0A397UP27_9GLOM|nr:kinase-like domain-containing protein [Gigaspora rosea]
METHLASPELGGNSEDLQRHYQKKVGGGIGMNLIRAGGFVAKSVSEVEWDTEDNGRQLVRGGKLHQYMRIKFKKLKWKDKLLRLTEISKELIQIHEAGYIHCDFHSGNILQHKEELWLEKIIKSYITDLGSSRNNKESTLKKGICGVLPYIAPEILLGKKFTQAADIYGFGVIMAEITTGIPPFDGYLFNNDLAIKICGGLRPDFAPGTPNCYIKLAKLCMNSDPQKRPTAKMLFDEFSKWYDFMNEQDTDDEVDTFDEYDESDESNELDERSEISNKFWEADEIIQQQPITTQKNLDSVYTSQFVDVDKIFQRFSEEVKSGNIADKYAFEILSRFYRYLMAN